MVFANPLLLLGLAAVLIPPAVHLFGRRRFQEVDWGATQFLRLTPRSRRRVFVERWRLMAVRMAVLALLALALAGPTVRGSLLNYFEPPRSRTTVLLIDVSASMGAKSDGRTRAGRARDVAAAFLSRMRPGDRAAVLAVKGEPIPLLDVPTPDADQARAALDLLPAPAGSADWPRAVEAAEQLLREVEDEAEVLVVTDGQRFGWADADAVTRWGVLARRSADTGSPPSRIWVVNVGEGRPEPRPAVTSFRIASAARTTTSDVRFEGVVARPDTTSRLRLAVDGRAAGEVPLDPARPHAPFSFTRRLPPGSHLVTVRVDPDEAAHLAIDVFLPHPVLIVDGDPRTDAATRGGDFLRRALSPAHDPSPAFVPRLVSTSRFSAADLNTKTESAPRVVVLANVEKLSEEQGQAVESFAAGGGGVLVTLGDRTNAVEWNRAAYRGGRGWLPAQVLEARTTDAGTAPGPRTSNLDHPAVTRFSGNPPGGLQTAVFPRHWKLRPTPGAFLSLTNGDPLLVEKAVGRGRVVVSAVLLDGGWESNLVRLPDFVPLCHELCHHLVGGTSRANLVPGEPIVFHPSGEPPGSVSVVPPDGVPRRFPVTSWPASFDATTDPGVYRVTSTAGVVRHFVVRPDPREADLTPADESDRAKVAAAVGRIGDVTSLDDLQSLRGRAPPAWDVGGLLLVAVLLLLVAELWHARWGAA